MNSPLATTVVLTLATISAVSDDQVFYRLAGPSETTIQSLTADGFLSWSHSASEGTFLIEKTSDLPSTNWQPVARGFVTNTSSLRVFDPATPAGMRFIPGGHFRMGDNTPGLPTIGNVEHTVFISPFYIGMYEATAEEVRDVFQWALDNGKVVLGGILFSNTHGDSRGLLKVNSVDSLLQFDGTTITLRTGRSGHPCTAVTWYGAVAYCNFRGEMEGREMCYDLADWSCDFTKSGYRLPTESEWEKAARGGYEGRLFPWGNTITHSDANYRSSTNNFYDISSTRDFHPVYDANRPIRTSPVGSFAPNGFGLYDVSGNVFEWLWDIPGRYTGGTMLVDPTGPETPLMGGQAMFKGGTWLTTAERVLLASRYTAATRNDSHSDIGFRVVLRPNMQ